jgi:hypothetical protein
MANRKMKWPSNLSPVLAFLAACASPAVVMGADNPPATKAVLRDAAPTEKRPMVIQNPDGTITVQKEPPKPAKDTKAQKGLVIPAQVIVPITPAPEKRN